MTTVGTSKLYERLRALEALWKSTESGPEKTATMRAMRKQEAKIREAGDKRFSLDAYLSGAEHKDAPSSARAGAGAGETYYEIVVARSAGWAVRLLDILEEQRRGAVVVSVIRGKRKSDPTVYELRGEAALELFDHWVHYYNLLCESDAYAQGGDEGMNLAFEVIDIVRKDLVG